MTFDVYLLECIDKSYYCGYTSDLKRRVEEHNSGTGGRYTRARIPVKLIYHEKCESRSLAMKRECEIKTFSKKQKEMLVIAFQKELNT